ncbi:ABC transporter substrate-binding protein [Nonomuraea sp. NPDC059023]|uniref:ABC transporter substrate-binding protein n=1 Tax=unclassified Nonomuraea TaxID=2593643 RepID=UPI0036A37177
MQLSHRLAAASGAAALALTGCAAGGGTDGPIKVGSINGVTGQFQAPEVPKAVQAVFDEVNAAGGIGGRTIEFISKDDAMNPQRSTEAAVELIESEGVVALVGSSSAVDCGLNRAKYGSAGIVSIPAVGVDPACFTSPNIAPVNPGPYKLLTAALYFLSQTKKHEKVCAYLTVLPGSGDGIENAIKEWSTVTGKQLTVKETSVGTGDPTPYLVKAKEAGCTGIVYNSQVGPWFAQAKTQGMTAVDFAMLANSYTDANAQAIPEGLNVYSATEWQPYTDESLPGNDRWAKIVGSKGIPKTAFSQGAVMAADVFVQVLKGIRGPITRESVTKAFKEMKPVDYPMVGTPYVFGPGEAHNPVEGARFVKAENRAWRVLPEGFVVPGKG